jgi:hypothetical protein
MTNDGLTLFDISTDVAAKMFSDVPASKAGPSIYVSAIDVAQRDYLRFLNRCLNKGDFSATLLISGRNFVVGNDNA